MRRTTRRQITSVACLVVAIMAVFAIGFAGFTTYYERHPEPTEKTVLDRAYRTWQLFTLESGSVDGSAPLTLEIARVLAPITSAAAVLQILLLFIEGQANRIWIRLLKNHTIVCGLTDAGFHVVASALSAGRTVVVVDQNEDPALREKCKDKGAFFLAAEPTEPAALLRAGIRRARALVAVHGDEGENVSTALAAERALGASKRDHPLPCHVQILDYQLAALFKQSRIFVRGEGPLDVNIFNAYEAAARVTSESNPLDREPIGVGDERTPHLIVLGLGRMGLSLALQYAKVSHFANGKRLRITAFDREARRREDEVRARHTALPDVCDLRFEPAELDDPRAMTRLREIVSEPGQLVTVAVCIAGDSRALACALSVHAALDGIELPVLIRLATQDGLAALLDQQMQGVRLVPFGTTEEVNHWSTLDDEVLDKQAVKIHEFYAAKGHTDGAVSVGTGWRKLDPALQDSCRQQADHIPVKLRAVGCEIVPLTETNAAERFEFDPEETVLLARMEHARWVAERRLGGWQYGLVKDVNRKTSPDLVAYDALDEPAKQKDKDTVATLDILVREAGGVIRRKSSGGPHCQS